MALENSRDFFKRMSEPIIKRLEGVEPYVLTWLTLPTGLAAAWCMMNATRDSSGALMFVGAFFLMGCAMALDGLDGNLARATGKVTRWGDYLDHSLDRVLDHEAIAPLRVFDKPRFGIGSLTEVEII